VKQKRFQLHDMEGISGRNVPEPRYNTKVKQRAFFFFITRS